MLLIDLLMILDKKTVEVHYNHSFRVNDLWKVFHFNDDKEKMQTWHNGRMAVCLTESKRLDMHEILDNTQK